MNEIGKTNLNDQTQFRLNKITKIKNYFNQEINQRKSCKKIKYICCSIWLHRSSFNCSFSKKWWSLYYFFCKCCWSSNWSSRSKFCFKPLTTEIINKLLSITRNKKREHDKILILAKSKLNSIETLVFQPLMGMEISHEEFIAILKEKNKYEKIEENLRIENEKPEIMRLNSMKSRT